MVAVLLLVVVGGGVGWVVTTDCYHGDGRPRIRRSGRIAYHS